MAAARQLRLGAFMRPASIHTGAWRYPGAVPDANFNFPLMKQVVVYAREEAAKRGRKVEFSLTTNATLLSGTIIDFLVEHGIGVTVSMDGTKEMQDKFRIFSNGIEPGLGRTFYTGFAYEF